MKDYIVQSKTWYSETLFLMCYHDLRPAVNEGAPQHYVNLMGDGMTNDKSVYWN